MDGMLHWFLLYSSDFTVLGEISTFSDLSLSGIQNTNKAFLCFPSTPPNQHSTSSLVTSSSFFLGASTSLGYFDGAIYHSLPITESEWLAQKWAQSPTDLITMLFRDLIGGCVKKDAFSSSLKTGMISAGKKSVSMPTLIWLISFTENKYKNSIKTRGTYEGIKRERKERQLAWSLVTF